MMKGTRQLHKWTGTFGRKYTDRNSLDLKGMEKLHRKNYGMTRTAINRLFLGGIDRSARVLEVGTNIGLQLECLRQMGFENLYGIEPQKYACEIAQERLHGINIIEGDIFDIPFKDRFFDLVFTSGVLIHISPHDIKKGLEEIHRCTDKYIFGLEYFSSSYKEIAYRGEKDLLWKTDFAKLYLDSFKDLRLVKEKRLCYLENDNVDMVYLLKRRRG